MTTTSQPDDYPHGCYAIKARRTPLKGNNVASTVAERWSQALKDHGADFLGSTEDSISRLSRSFGEDPLWRLNGGRAAGDHGLAGQSLVDPGALGALLAVRNLNRLVLEGLESESTFEASPWNRAEGGGGVMSVLRGRDIEKSAVNMSLVTGDKYPSIESAHAGKPFTACGVSLICHPFNPHAPIAHMNVRILTVGKGPDAVTWIGGGGDLTPMIPYEEDTQEFHGALRQACMEHPLGDYTRFKAWCDEYFFIPHRGQTRGVGGIFFDYIPLTSPEDASFLFLVGRAFAQAYGAILARRLNTAFTDEQKEEHLFWRGRYAEFNLVYDRGTRFGLLSGGNLDAIFGSLPPVVKW